MMGYGEYILVHGRCQAAPRLLRKAASHWPLIAGDKTFCIHLAKSEALIHEHARRSGFPATYVPVVHKMIDPVTAEG